MKIELMGRNIPRDINTKDPKFLQLGEFLKPEERNEGGDFTPPTLLDIFTPNEIVELVNRALYQLEYQRTAHRDRSAKERERLKPLKAKVKQMFHVSFIKATEDQIQKAMTELEKEKT